MISSQTASSATLASSAAIGRVTPGHKSLAHPGVSGRQRSQAARKSRSTTTGRGSRSAHSVAAAQSAGSAGKSNRIAVQKAAPALTCTGTSGMLPQNYAAIVSFLTARGYTRFAAAGIAGNIYQESQGNPESVGTGGGGLIGWTPLPAGFVTGNPAADLKTQLQALLTYNQQWASYLPALNAATSATQAADIYMNYFERPGIPAAYNREEAAAAVAAACGF